MLIFNQIFMKIRGFTLLEISVVILMIGLLTGGITIGVDMIKKSRLKSIMQDFQKYTTASNLFLSRYGALPGDFNQADRFFANCVTYNSVPCNGNQNGFVENGTESLRFFEHLSKAELVSGFYEYNAAAVTPYYYYPTNNELDVFIVPISDTYFDFEGTMFASGRLLSTPEWLTPRDAAYLDRKFDDGLVLSGIFTGYTEVNQGTNCFTLPPNPTYIESQSDQTCYILHLINNERH